MTASPVATLRVASIVHFHALATAFLSRPRHGFNCTALALFPGPFISTAFPGPSIWRLCISRPSALNCCGVLPAAEKQRHALGLHHPQVVQTR